MGNVISNDPTIQMSNDELYLFRQSLGIPEQSTLDQIKKSFSNAIEALVKQNEDIIRDNQLERCELMTKLTEVINSLSESTKQNAVLIETLKSQSHDHSNPLFYTSYDKEHQEVWKMNMLGVIGKRCVDKGDYNFDKIYDKIFDGMKRDGYDVNELIQEHRQLYPGASLLDMCARSDVLRLSCEKNVNTVCHQRIVNQYKAVAKNKTTVKRKMCHGDVTYKEAHSIPKEIYNVVRFMAKDGKPIGPTYRKAKNYLVNKHNLDVNKIVEETKQKYKISSCNVWFAVAQYPELISALLSAVSQF